MFDSRLAVTPSSPVLLDRVQHAHVGEAAAQHAGHRLLDLGVGRLGILIEECLRREDDAVQAEPALRRLMLDEGALQRMRGFDGSQSLERDEIGAFHGGDRRHARSDRPPRAITVHAPHWPRPHPNFGPRSASRR
jgi:hypothetical protein